MFLEVFIQGLRDGFGFLPSINILLFFIFLVVLGRTRGEIVILGFFFLLSIWIAHDFLIFGIFDAALRQKAVFVGIETIYLLLALGLMILGVCHLWDWFCFRKNSESGHCLINVTWPQKKTSVDVVKFEWSELRRLALKGAIAFFTGLILMVLSSLSVDDYGTFIDFMGWASGGERRRAIELLITHTLAFSIPLICVWILMLAVASSGKLSEKMRAVFQTSFSKIIAAAVFLSLGVGLGYTFLKS